MDDVNLGELGHKLKSPLVTIKSLAFILKNKADIKDKKLIKGLGEIETKVDILNSRIDLLIKYLEYQKGEVKFLYEIFDVFDLKKEIQKNSKVKISFFKKTIIADKEKLILALTSFLNSLKTKEIKASGKNNQIIFEIFFTNNALQTNNFSIELFIANRIIELHNGSVRKEKNKLEIIIPQKPTHRRK